MKLKKKRSASPTKLVLSKLRKTGLICQVVEQFIFIPGMPGFRRDLFNCIDILAIAGNDTIGVQCTSDSNHGNRVTKSLGIGEMKLWLKSPMRKYLVISVKKNELSNRWLYRASEIYLDNGIISVRKFYLRD